MRVEAAGAGSRVTAEADVDLSGRAAQMGRGIVEDVARRLVGDMAACLEAGLATEAPAAEASAGPADASAPPPPPPPSPAPLKGGSLLLGVARDRLRDPRVAAAAVAALALLARTISKALRRRRDA